MTRPPTKGHFASWNGTAPLDASSGDRVRHRLSRAGNRQINQTLHIMATVLAPHGHARRGTCTSMPAEAVRPREG
jgi:transposase